MLLAQTSATPAQPAANPAPPPKAAAHANADLTFKIIAAANNTFCYDVYVEGRLMIHQTSAPGLPGNEGFETKAGAEKVARLVMDKIRKGEMPPTVTIDEMKKLNAIK